MEGDKGSNKKNKINIRTKKAACKYTGCLIRYRDSKNILQSNILSYLSISFSDKGFAYNKIFKGYYLLFSAITGNIPIVIGLFTL